MNIHTITTNALALARRNDGATILKNGKEATKGYASGGIKEYKLPWNLSEESLLDAIFTAFVSINAIECDAYGLWVDGDTLYIDAVTIFEDPTKALAFAAKNNELAIYCIHNEETIDV